MMRSSDGGGMVVARDREERGVGYCMRWGPRMILMRRRMRFEGFLVLIFLVGERGRKE